MTINMHVETSDEALLRIILAGGAAKPRLSLLKRYGTAQAVLDAGKKAWQQVGCDSRQCMNLINPDPVLLKESRRWLGGRQHSLIGWHQADYPPLLRYITAPPVGLFVDGDPMLLWHPSIAIVGTRHPDQSGLDCAFRFAYSIARSGLAIVSGLAQGIDACAHRAALATPKPLTVAILGTGPDRVYPKEHRLLQQQIATNGVVVSEYPPGTPVRRGHFPARNRLIAGLTLGTLVIQATRRSGALITAHLALAAGRNVFAIPGPLHHPMVQGCHALIRDGAILVESPDQLVDGLGPLAQLLAREIRARLTDIDSGIVPIKTPAPKFQDQDYAKVWDALGHDYATMDQIVHRCGLTVSVLSSILVTMEMEGYVSVKHGRYCRKA